MKTCPECGCRVYALGCVNCNEAAYIEEQIQLTEHYSENGDKTEAYDKWLSRTTLDARAEIEGRK